MRRGGVGRGSGRGGRVQRILHRDNRRTLSTAPGLEPFVWIQLRIAHD